MKLIRGLLTIDVIRFALAFTVVMGALYLIGEFYL